MIFHLSIMPSIFYLYLQVYIYHLLSIYHLSIHYPSIYLLSTYHFFTYYLSIICVCLSLHLSMYLSIHIYLLSSVHFSHSVMSDSLNRGMPGPPVHHQLKAFIQTHIHQVVMPSNHLIVCRPLLLLPSIFPSIRVFSSESVLHIWWLKYWSFSLSISPSNEYSGLISFRMDWLDLLAIQGTLKSLLQHHSSKSSILQHSAFFMVQLSHPYMTTGKTTALTRRTFVDKLKSLLFNMLPSLVITFLLRSKHLLLSWLQSPSA